MVDINTVLRRADAAAMRAMKAAFLRCRSSAVLASRSADVALATELFDKRLESIRVVDRLTDAMMLAHDNAVAAWHHNRLKLSSPNRIVKKASKPQRDALRELYASIARGTTDKAMTNVRDVMLKNVVDVVQDKKEKSFRRQLRMKGPEHILETVALTQTAIAFNAASWIEGANDEEIWGYEYSTAGDERVRPAHADIDGIKYPKSHEFWTAYAPPNGYRCRCSLIPILRGDRRARTKPFRGTPEVDAMFAFNMGALLEKVL